MPRKRREDLINPPPLRRKGPAPGTVYAKRRPALTDAQVDKLRSNFEAKLADEEWDKLGIGLFDDHSHSRILESALKAQWRIMHTGSAAPNARLRAARDLQSVLIDIAKARAAAAAAAAEAAQAAERNRPELSDEIVAGYLRNLSDEHVERVLEMARAARADAPPMPPLRLAGLTEQ